MLSKKYSLLFVFIVLFGLAYVLARQVNPISGEDYVTIRIKAKVPVYDLFELYYRPEGVTEYSGANLNSRWVFGLEGEQDILFFLPHSMPVEGLRLDIGQDPSQSSIVISSITVEKDGSSHVLSAENLEANQFISLGYGGTYNLKAVDGKYDPFFTVNSDGLALYEDVRTQVPFRWMFAIVVACAITFIFSKPSIDIVLKTAAGVAIFFALSDYLVSRSRKMREITVTVNAVVEVNDRFQLLVETETESFAEERSAYRNVTGSRQEQAISFQFPQSSEITKLRIDLGSNPLQRPIQISSVVIGGGNVVTLRGEDIFKVFNLNGYIKRGEQSSTLITQQLKGEYATYDPFLVSNHLGPFVNYFSHNTQKAWGPLTGSFLAAMLVVVCLTALKAVTVSNLVPAAFIFSFSSLLILPWLDAWFGFNLDVESAEKRTLATKPIYNSLEPQEFPLAYESYYIDHFGFRNVLVRWSSKWKTDLFRSSPTPEKALFGKDDWLFYTGEDDNILDDITRKNLFSTSNLESLAETLHGRAATLDSMGIRYVKAIWPDKHSIYFEKLPFALSVQRVDTISKTDQLIRLYESTFSGLKVVSPQADLLKAKDSVQVYLKNDTHWNDYGAWIGYNRLMIAVNASLPDIRPAFALSDFDVTWIDDASGDILGLMGLDHNKSFKDRVPRLTPRNANFQIVELPSDGYPDRTLHHKNTQSDNQRRVLVFRDSYSIAIIPFLSRHFAEVLYVRTPYDQDIVNAYKPDLVIDAFVARLSN